jgi:hypothetical protein
LEKGDGRVVIDGFSVHRADETQLIRDFAVCGISSLTQAPDFPC